MLGKVDARLAPKLVAEAGTSPNIGLRGQGGHQEEAPVMHQIPVRNHPFLAPLFMRFPILCRILDLPHAAPREFRKARKNNLWFALAGPTSLRAY